MELSQEETDRLVGEYFANGGIITRIESHRKPRPRLQLFKPEFYQQLKI